MVNQNTNTNSSDKMFDVLLSIAFVAAIYSLVKAVTEPIDAIPYEGRKILKDSEKMKNLNEIVNDYHLHPENYGGDLVINLDDNTLRPRNSSKK